MLLNWVSLTRGPMGITNIPRPVLFGVTIKSGSQYLYLSLTMFLIVYLLLNHILRSKFGRNLRAIKEDETAAERWASTCIRKRCRRSAWRRIGRRGGSMLAHYMVYISPSLFVGDFSTTILSMVVLGGMGSMPGSVIAATLLTVIPECSADWTSTACSSTACC